MEKILPPYYPAVFVMRRLASTKGMRGVDLWHFKSTKLGRMYLVEVEEYDNHIYSIKFYPKNMATSSRRFSFLTGDNEPRRIIVTCIRIMKLYFERDSRSSFAFIGAHAVDETIKNNKRFRFYLRMLKIYVSQRTFIHYVDEQRSACVIARRSEVESQRLSIQDVTKFFREIYILD